MIADLQQNFLSFVDILGWVAFITVLLGKWYVIKKKWEGYLIQVLGDVVWILFGIKLAMPSVIFSEAVFLLFALWGMVVWRTRYKEKMNANKDVLSKE